MNPNGLEAILFITLRIFLQSSRPYFGKRFLKAFKHQSNFVGAQNIVSLFKAFSLVLFIKLTVYPR